MESSNTPDLQTFQGHAEGSTTIRLSLFACLICLTAPLLSVSLNASETDDRIAASAQDSYVFKTYLSGDSVKIESTDGAVTLSGTVSDSSKMTLAKQTVETLPGVKSVKNALTTTADDRLEDADNLIAMKVNFLLLLHPNVNVKTTDVAVHDGIVTLRGGATSLAQKELTAEYAGDVAGVKKIENEMTLAGKAASLPSTIGERIDDASITAQIKTSLVWHRSTSAIHTNVETKDGAVTISGIAKNDAEKALVSKIAKDIHGVVTVGNTMTVEGAEGSGLQRQKMAQ